MAKLQFRDSTTGPALCPPWLCGFDTNAQKFMYVIGMTRDLLTEKINEGMIAKLPNNGDPSVLPIQGADRLMVQGPAETNSAFSNRLQDAFAAWAHSGSRRSVLGQIQAYLAGVEPGVDTNWPTASIVGGNSAASTWDVLYGYFAQGDKPYHSKIASPNWNWDGNYTPSMAWLILYMNLGATTASGAAMSVASVGGSGVTGVTSGFATLTGLSGFVAADAQSYLTISGAASSANNGTFQIASVLSTTSVVIANTAAVAADANNGSISWTLSDYEYIGPAPVWGSSSAYWSGPLVATSQTGATATVSAVFRGGFTGDTSTITGMTGLTSGNVGDWVTFTGGASGGNNGTFRILSVASATSLVVANSSGVAPDANNGAISWTVKKISPAYSWGLDCSYLVVESIRAILKRWKSAGTFYPNIIVSFGGADGTAGTEFSPLSSQGSGNPDGTWGGIGKLSSGVWIPAKQPLNHFTSFCDGTGQAVRCYEKNRT